MIIIEVKNNKRTVAQLQLERIEIFKMHVDMSVTTFSFSFLNLLLFLLFRIGIQPSVAIMIIITFYYQINNF